MIQELKTKRTALIDSARKILNTAEAEGRSALSADELQKYDAIMADADAIKATIERTERIQDEDRAASELLPRKTVSAVGNGFVEDACVALKPEQRCAQVVAVREGLPEITTRDYSLGRIVKAMVTGDRRSLTEHEKRAMSEGTDSAGGYTTWDRQGSRVIDRIRNQMRVVQAGALTVPMDSDTVNLARLASGATTAWKAENAAITAGDLTFERVQLVSKTLPVLVKMSVELFEDMQDGTEEIIEREIAQAIALELDRVALRGSGSGQEPRGIVNQSGVTLQSSGANGAVPTNHDFLVDAIGSIWAANGEPNARIYASRTAQKLAKLKDSTGQPLRAPDAVTAVKELISNQVPINLTVGTSVDCSEAYVGQFSELLIGMRTAFRLEASRVAGNAFENLQVYIRAYIRADVALAHPAVFTVVQGVR
jgi:HK97 family phage major capsid protein